jgi:hypothetical protein
VAYTEFVPQTCEGRAAKNYLTAELQDDNLNLRILRSGVGPDLEELAKLRRAWAQTPTDFSATLLYWAFSDDSAELRVVEHLAVHHATVLKFEVQQLPVSSFRFARELNDRRLPSRWGEIDGISDLSQSLESVMKSAYSFQPVARVSHGSPLIT